MRIAAQPRAKTACAPTSHWEGVIAAQTGVETQVFHQETEQPVAEEEERTASRRGAAERVMRQGSQGEGHPQCGQIPQGPELERLELKPGEVEGAEDTSAAASEQATEAARDQTDQQRGNDSVEYGQHGLAVAAGV